MLTLEDAKELASKAFTLGKALLTGETVSEEVMQKRLEICSGCENVNIQIKDGEKQLSCGICGCRIRGDRALVNLARYKETGDYGCKHLEGSKWATAGLSGNEKI